MIVDICGHLIDIFIDGGGCAPGKNPQERAQARAEMRKRNIEAIASDARTLENRYMTDSAFALWLDTLMGEMGDVPYPMSMAMSDSEKTALEHEYDEFPDNPYFCADRAKRYLKECA